MASRRGSRGTGRQPARRGVSINRSTAVVLAFAGAIVVALGLLGAAWWSNASRDWAEVVRVGDETANRAQLLERMDVLAFLVAERTTRAETLTGSRDADAVARLRRALDAQSASLVEVAQGELADELLLRRELGDEVPAPDAAAEIALLLTGDLDRHVRWITLGPGGTGAPGTGADPGWPAPPVDALPDAALVADLEARIRPALESGDLTAVLAAAGAAGWRAAAGDAWVGGEERVEAFDPGFRGLVATAEGPGPVEPTADPSGRISFGQVVDLVRGTDDGATRIELMHQDGIKDEAINRWAWLRAARRAMAARLVDRAATQPAEQVRAEELVIGRADRGAKGPWVRLAQLAVSRLPADQGGGDASAASALAADLNGRPIDDRLARWDALVATDAGGTPAGGELGFFTREQLAGDVAATVFDPAVAGGAVMGPFTTATGPTLFLLRTRYDGPLDEAAIGALLQITDASDLHALAIQLDPAEALRAKGLAWRALAEVGAPSAASRALNETALGRVAGPYALGGQLFVARPLERRVAVADADQLARIRALGLDAWLEAARGAPDVTVKQDPLAQESPAPSTTPGFSSVPVRTPTLPSIPGAAVPTGP